MICFRIVGLAIKQLLLYQKSSEGDLRHVLDLGIRYSWVVVNAELAKSRFKLQSVQRLLPFSDLQARAFADLDFTCHICELQLGLLWHEDLPQRYCITCGAAKRLAHSLVGYDCVDTLDRLLADVDSIARNRQGRYIRFIRLHVHSLRWSGLSRSFTVHVRRIS